MIYQLGEEIVFPDPAEAEPDGVLAFGGDLSPERLTAAYSLGIFPWFPHREEVPAWYCPRERFVIFPDEIHISHSMRNLMNRGELDVTFNHEFRRVIEGCAELRRDEPGAWLGHDMIEAYCELHRRGLAQSVEVWKGNKLVGGLYGVTIGTGFFGESMFSRIPSASKLALIRLASQMKDSGGRLIDCQFETPHLRSMGGRFISYAEYMRILRQPVFTLPD